MHIFKCITNFTKRTNGTYYFAIASLNHYCSSSASVIRVKDQKHIFIRRKIVLPYIWLRRKFIYKMNHNTQKEKQQKIKIMMEKNGK
jgi:hypothetical protein